MIRAALCLVAMASWPSSDAGARVECTKAPATWKACAAAKTALACTKAGGQWRDLDLWGPQCFCPTGQAGCPCTGERDCRGECLVSASENGQCPAGPGVCSEWSKTGGGRCVRTAPTTVKWMPPYE